MAGNELWEMLQNLKSPKYKWVDLSHEVSPETPHYEGFPALRAKDYYTFDKEKVCSIDYSLVTQYGTHVDAPYHFVESGRRLHEIGVGEMAYPLCVIDVSEKVKANNDYGLTVNDIKAWEKEHGAIPAGSFVAMRTDWSKRRPQDFDNKDAEGNCHYPGWTLEALKYVCEERKVGAIGHEPSDTDPAYTQKVALWAGELYYLGQNKFQIEMLKNLDQLPATGAVIFCTFPNVKDAPGFTARCFAICPA